MRTAVFNALAITLCLTTGLKAEAEATFLTDVTLVDVEAGTLTPDQSLLIRNGVIAEIGAFVAPGDATVVDAEGGFLIPGLWDSHVHVFSSQDEPDTAFPLYLINGITGIRDMGALWSSRISTPGTGPRRPRPGCE